MAICTTFFSMNPRYCQTFRISAINKCNHSLPTHTVNMLCKVLMLDFNYLAWDYKSVIFKQLRIEGTHLISQHYTAEINPQNNYWHPLKKGDFSVLTSQVSPYNDIDLTTKYKSICFAIDIYCFVVFFSSPLCTNLWQSI